MKRIHGTLSVRLTRSKKISTLKTEDGVLFRVRMVPWLLIEENNSCVWLVSMAVGKSNRQINDWMNKRKNKRSRKLSQQLNGKRGLLFQLRAMDQLRKWVDLVPANDSIIFKCESVQANKQFRIWKKWFELRESNEWKPMDSVKGFYLYKTTS